MIRALLNRLKNLLYPPKCRACGVFLTNPETVLCPDCQAAWEKEKAERGFGGIAPRGTNGFVTLVQYRKQAYSVGKRLVLRIKDKRDRDLIRFLVRDLTLEIKLSGKPFDGVTYAPRGRSKRREMGTDQAECLAKELAEAFHVPLYPVLVHIGEGEQKRNRSGDRILLAKASYRLKKKNAGDVSGKRLLLVDDILTTGATLSACAALLRQAGARSVTAVTVARTVLQSEKNSTEGKRYS